MCYPVAVFEHDMVAGCFMEKDNYNTKTDSQTGIKAFQECSSTCVLESIIENLPYSVIVTDESGVIKFTNKNTENFFDCKQNDYINKNLNEFLSTANIEEMQDSIKYDFKTSNNEGHILYLKLERKTIKHNNELYYIFTLLDETQNKEAEKLKNQFVSMISHELRTPLTSIRGALGLVSSGVLGTLPDKVKELVDIAGSNSIRLVNIINDILDLEKIKAGKMEFNFNKYPLIELINETVDFNKGYAAQYNVEYKVVQNIDKELVNVDKDRFIQVLTNLLSNAAKFSIKNEKVIISVDRNNYMLRVSVTNKGAGIPEEAHSKIFESFSQVKNSGVRRKDGTGLGLSISKSIMQKMGGNIGFSSIVNQETTFYFELPEAHLKNNNKNILICEDDQTTAHYIQKMFQIQGYHADVAYNAKQAQDYLAQKEYYLMTLDIILPDKNGLILLNEIKNNEKTKKLPVIVISALDEDFVESDIKHEAVAWIEKSFDSKKLEKTITEIMYKKHTDKIKILHVEHDEDISKIVSLTLSENANVTNITTLAEAERIIDELVFDLIIIDYKFPNGTCEQLIDKIKISPNQDANLVILSAYEINPSIAEKVNMVICKTKVSNEQLLKCLEPFINKTNQVNKTNEAEAFN